jgi:crotonobetainyl-CoA:carnitine CoA-transferase CaiB-like acyl-CoA transferase
VDGTPTAERPLAGLRVLDLSRYLPGPLATLHLAELGAEVVKLEPPQGDPARVQPPFERDGTSTLHGYLNRGKRSLVLDLRRDDARAAARALVRRSDVLVESFRPGVLTRLGLDPAELRAEHPRLVLCSISGFGQDGPHRLLAGHDLTYLALAGALGLGGLSGGAPLDPPVQPADNAGGQAAVSAILAALLHRERTGEGAHLDVSLHREAARAIGWERRAVTLGLPPSEPGGGLLTGGLACYRCYPTADGRALALAALEPHFFERLCRLLGRPDLQAQHLDPTAQPRLAAELAATFASRPLAHWQDLLDGEDVACAAVLTVAEALTFAPDAPSTLTPAPELGEHTAEILASL